MRSFDGRPALPVSARRRLRARRHRQCGLGAFEIHQQIFRGLIATLHVLRHQLLDDMGKRRQDAAVTPAPAAVD